jgi:hypothetical protein
MAQSAPQYPLWKIIGKIKVAIMTLFWVIFALSILPVFFKSYLDKVDGDDIINVLNIVCLSLFFILDTTVDFVLTPMADSTRRDDFIDNAFGSTFATHPSVGYYTNNSLSQGIYKAAVNLFENCFFTYSLTKSIIHKRIIATSLILLLVGACSWFGFRQVPFALSLLQVLFSAKLLGAVVKQCILLTRLDHILDNLISLFQQQDFRLNHIGHEARFYRLWLKYESLHSTIPAEIPDKTYQQLNPALSAEWENIKIRYNIN